MTRVDEALLARMNDSIRNGQGRVARRILRESQLTGVQRKHRAALANIARRADLPNLAVTLLNPLVNPAGRQGALNRLGGRGATDTEKAEYAAALASIGAADEALRLLGEVDPIRAPVSLLYRAFALFGAWDYESSLPLLEQYVRSPGISEYECLVGKVNLAAALVHVGQLDRAEPMLSELTEASQANRYRLLLGNVLEVRAQGAIRMRDWKSAERLLSSGRAALGKSGGLGWFFIRKWEAVLALRRPRRGPPDLESLAELKREALSLRHWETLRDLDLVAACATRDPFAAIHVYAGTPFASFRNRLIAEFPGPLEIPSVYVWQVAPIVPNGKPARSIDLIEGKVRPRGRDLEPGRLRHRLLSALASDFYHPLRVPGLFARLYPGESYNPIQSPVRVHQALMRLRAWVREERLPLEIEESNGFYRLAGHGLEIVVPTGEREDDASGLIFRRLMTEFAHGVFRARDACRALGMTERTAQRTLSRWVSEGRLLRTGEARATAYRFPCP